MPRSLSLDQLGLQYGTDKASTGNDYLNFYESFLQPLRNDELNILEIGILSGASLKMWEHYFPRANIVGADIISSTMRFAGGRISVELLDQSNIEELTRMAVRRGPFDLVIEDGSHLWEHQITSLRTLFPFVRDNGFYIAEDLHTNYASLGDTFRGISSITCVDYLKRWLDLCLGHDIIDSDDVEDAFLRTYAKSVRVMAFSRRVCLIQKRSDIAPRLIAVGRAILGDDVRAATLEVKIIVHLSVIGDVFGGQGFINIETATHTFQGLAIEPGEVGLEYRVCVAGSVWLDWVSNGELAGARGTSDVLTGFAVRLGDAFRGRYAIRVVGRFFDGSVSVAQDGQDCISPTGTPLCGVQIDVWPTD